MGVGELLQSFIRRTVCGIVDGALNVWNEVFKFLLILFVLYYFCAWSFQFMDIILHEHTPDQSSLTSEHQHQFGTDLSLEANQIADETYLRIGPPDEDLIRQRASLLEKLEIEAEYEENLDRHNTSQANIEPADQRDIQTGDLKLEDGDDISWESNGRGKASQTDKTRVGKKSKLVGATEIGPTTSNPVYNNEEDKDDQLLETQYTNEVKENSREAESPSKNKDYDNESS